MVGSEKKDSWSEIKDDNQNQKPKKKHFHSFFEIPMMALWC